MYNTINQKAIEDKINYISMSLKYLQADIKDYNSVKDGFHNVGNKSHGYTVLKTKIKILRQELIELSNLIDKNEKEEVYND